MALLYVDTTTRTGLHTAEYIQKPLRTFPLFLFSCTNILKHLHVHTIVLMSFVFRRVSELEYLFWFCQQDIRPRGSIFEFENQQSKNQMQKFRIIYVTKEVFHPLSSTWQGQRTVIFFFTDEKMLLSIYVVRYNKFVFDKEFFCISADVCVTRNLKKMLGNFLSNINLFRKIESMQSLGWFNVHTNEMWKSLLCKHFSSSFGSC
jgi:hypothetical protein